MPEAKIYHNPRCSKSRACLQILEDREVAVRQVRYLEETPSREELEWLWQRLGPTMLRSGESLYKELSLAQASVAEIFDAILQHPILLERPIVVMNDRAVVARPPEKVHELLMERQ